MFFSYPVIVSLSFISLCCSDIMKMHITYMGLMSFEDNKFSYSGGKLAKDYCIDPDLMTWSIFEEFTERQGIRSGVKEVWYRLPNEDISVARCIYKDKDNEIRKMCEEVASVGEVYFYIEHGISHPCLGNVGDIPAYVIDDRVDAGVDAGADADNEQEEEDNEEEDVPDGELEPEENNDEDGGNDEEFVNDENREAESEGEEGANEVDSQVHAQPSEDEAEIVGEGAVDPRFDRFFANAEEEAKARFGSNLPNITGEASSDSDNEEDNGVDVGEYPDSPIDTDEEWANFNKKKILEVKGEKEEALLTMIRLHTYG